MSNWLNHSVYQNYSNCFKSWMHWGLITCPTCKNCREVKSVAQKDPFRSQCTSIESTIKKPIRSPYNSTWLLSWCAFYMPPLSLDVQVQDQLEASKASKKSFTVVSIEGDPYVMGGLGRNVFPPKQWLVNLSFVPFLAKQSSESTVHQSLTRSNLFNLASEILIRPSLHSLKSSEKSGQIRQWWCSQSYPLGLCPRHLRTAPKELEKEVAPQQGSTERCQFPAQESGDRTWMKDGSSWKFCHSKKCQQKIPEEGIHHRKEITKKNKPEAFSEATQDEIDKWCRRIKSTATSPFNLQSHQGKIQTYPIQVERRCLCKAPRGPPLQRQAWGSWLSWC